MVALQAWQGTGAHTDDGYERRRATAPQVAPTVAEAANDAERIARLEAEVTRLRGAVEAARAERPGFRGRVADVLDDIGLSFGWGVVYFSLLPVWWRGQTLGKKLLKLRVVELGGQPLTPLRALKRYGGYVAGMATGGLGFLQMFWEPNRQALHDKAAHTVVIDVRAPQQT